VISAPPLTRDPVSLIDAALIEAPVRAGTAIFGRPLLERLLLICQRAGAQRFFIQVADGARDDLRAALGSFRDSPAVSLGGTFAEALEHLPADARCVALRGNLVLATPQLRRVIASQAAGSGEVVALESTDAALSGTVAAGPLRLLLNGANTAVARLAPRGQLPFALNLLPDDVRDAELRLARELRHATAYKDGPMARWFDRRLSWRISHRLARTAVTPNQVTVANTVIGLVSAWLFAFPGYWLRLSGALLSLLSTTLDGVDGELARLKMTESRLGARLDLQTDILVVIALFAGIAIGCYRASASGAYLYLLFILLGGFALAQTVDDRARRSRGEQAEWIANLDQVAGRDFVYLLFVLALLNRLYYFVWAAAFGTYVYAIVLWRLTNRRRSSGNPVPVEDSGGDFGGIHNRNPVSELGAIWTASSAASDERSQA
jgi:1L-myo-inositol 1-phosphate cytidylyltransferase / CDP-L-myo-inositol myo-inositolphosphotransferase